MKKSLQVGDLVWYNVGGNGKETVGFVIDQKEVVWRHASPWETTDKTYKNIVRIQWLRKGKLVPKPIPVPFYDNRFALMESEADIDQPGLDAATMREHEGAFFQTTWYEGQWFKVISSVEKK